MRFALVESEKANYPVTALCETLEVSTAGFYAWRRRGPCRRERENSALVAAIESIHRESRATYGSPRVHAELLERGHRVGLNRVSRLMREQGIAVRARRGFCRTTVSDPTHCIAPNTLGRDFEAEAPGQKWVCDTTFIDTAEGWLYLATMLDLYNREIVGWAMGDRNDQCLTGRALGMALERHAPPEGLLHHSDRGSTYTAGNYRELLAGNAMECSMSRRADCWDNAVAESFFATLKKELVHRVRFATRREAEAAIFEYIEVFYNRRRKHSTLGYTSPVDYRQNNTALVSAE